MLPKYSLINLSPSINLSKIWSVWTLVSYRFSNQYTAWKVSKCGVFSGSYFHVFGLNTEIYEVNFHIQSEYRKIRTRKNGVFGHFSRSGIFSKWAKRSLVVIINYYKTVWANLMIPFLSWVMLNNILSHEKMRYNSV